MTYQGETDWKISKISILGSKTGPNSVGEGQVKMNWWTWVKNRGRVAINFDSEVRFSPNSKNTEERILSFVWVETKESIRFPALVTTKPSKTPFVGSWISEEIDGLKFKGKLIRAKDMEHASVKVSIAENQHPEPTAYKGGNGQEFTSNGQKYTIHYQIIHPKFCERKYLTADITQEFEDGLEYLKSIVCVALYDSRSVSLEKVAPSWSERGLKLYPIINELEKIEANKEMPNFSVIARARLNDFWKWANQQHYRGLMDDAEIFALSSAYIANPRRDTASLVNQLYYLRRALHNEAKKEQDIRAIINQIQKENESTFRSDNTLYYLNLVRDTLEEPSRLTVTQVNELILGLVAVVSEIEDEALLRRDEAVLILSQARNR